MDQARISREIRAELGRQDLSRSDLARALAVSDSYIYRRLHGYVDWKLHEVAKIADALGVRPYKLLGTEPPRRPAPEGENTGHAEAS